MSNRLGSAASPGRSECRVYPCFRGGTMRATLHRLIKATILLVIIATASQASAERFDEGDIRGDYVFTFDGSAGGAPVAAVGRFFADGKGNLLNGSRILVVGGGKLDQSFTCTYVVRSDGWGAADCPVVGSPAESFSFVVFKHGEEAYLVGTTQGITIRGNVVRQR